MAVKAGRRMLRWRGMLPESLTALLTDNFRCLVMVTGNDPHLRRVPRRADHSRVHRLPGLPKSRKLPRAIEAVASFWVNVRWLEQTLLVVVTQQPPGDLSNFGEFANAARCARYTL